MKPEFDKRGVKMIALSCNDTSTHKEWIRDIMHYGDLDKAQPFPYPIIDDSSRELANLLGIVDPDEFDSKKMPLTARAVSLPYCLNTGKQPAHLVCLVLPGLCD